MTEESNPAGDIPGHVKNFLRSRIDSVGLLEVLLLLHAQPERSWTVDEANAELRSSRSSVAFRLARLASLALVTSSPPPDRRYRYAPTSKTDRSTVDDLAACYQRYRLRVIDLLLSKLDQLKDFSDSFRLWEEKDDSE